MDPKPIRNTNWAKIFLPRTASYAKAGQSITDIFGQISDGQSLITVIFNQSGYLAGISLKAHISHLRNNRFLNLSSFRI